MGARKNNEITNSVTDKTQRIVAYYLNKICWEPQDKQSDDQHYPELAHNLISRWDLISKNWLPDITNLHIAGRLGTSIRQRWFVFISECVVMDFNPDEVASRFRIEVAYVVYLIAFLRANGVLPTKREMVKYAIPIK